MSSGKPATTTTSRAPFYKSTTVSASASASSCVSSESVFSGISSARSLSADRVSHRKPNAPPHLRVRAEAILGILCHGSISEVRIRQLIGNSPDTSKALRMLLKQGKVKRSGAGGPSDPYIYVVNLANNKQTALKHV
ncbi:unnamed protein product [Withania somnifera]